MKRRNFLQKLGWSAAALGTSDATIAFASDRYARTLAAPGERKLALLIGIDRYGAQPLNGCVTDVELQQELLVHRFGFSPRDILSLTDEKATRQNIEDALVEFVGKQAKEGDTVVLHFSGYGRYLSETGGNLKNTLVPADSSTESEGTICDLPEERFWELLRSLPAHKSVVLLDSSYAYPGSNVWGVLRIRSLPESEDAYPIVEGASLASRAISLGPDPSYPPGSILLRATGFMHSAAETQWSGFSAGLFTYALTQQLWWAMPSTKVQTIIQRASCWVKQTIGTDPLFSEDLPVETDAAPGGSPFLLPPASDRGADGAIVSVDEGGKTATVWLAGIPAPVLEHYSNNSVLVTSSEGEAEQRLQLKSRDGLSAKVQCLDPQDPGNTDSLRPGMLVQESVRVLPRSIRLTVALDSRLERIERVDATSAFANIPFAFVVTAGEKTADCLFGPVLDTSRESAKAGSFLAQGSYALFSLGREVFPNTLGQESEAVKTAALRLTDNLRTLLAAKLVRLTGNVGSSRLGVRATLQVVEPLERVLLQQETLRTASATPASQQLSAGDLEDIKLASVPAGSQIQLQVQNDSATPTYLLLLYIDGSGAIAIYPLAFSSSDRPTDLSEQYQQVIQPGQTLTFPANPKGEGWQIQGSKGLAETYLICSRAPFERTTATLASALPNALKSRLANTFTDPLKVAEAVLDDLHDSSKPTAELATGDERALDANAWASLSFVYRVGSA